MQTFTSKSTLRPSVPIISVRDLVEGIKQYLQTIIVFEFERLDIEKYREDKQTSITLFGQDLDETLYGKYARQKVHITIWDKAVDSIDSKLWRDPTEIRISIPAEKKWMALLITPLADKSISIDVLKLWTGVPGF
jgi:hypothetical protein